MRAILQDDRPFTDQLKQTAVFLSDRSESISNQFIQGVLHLDTSLLAQLFELLHIISEIDTVSDRAITPKDTQPIRINRVIDNQINSLQSRSREETSSPTSCNPFMLFQGPVVLEYFPFASN